MLPDEETDENSPGALNLPGQRIALLGRLVGMNRREAASMLRDHGAALVDRSDPNCSLVVIGADELLVPSDELLDDRLREGVAEGRVEVITETELWQRVGLVPGDEQIRRLYTPAMLADLLGVSIAIVRRWQRRGLIVPVREVHRLAYFDFQQVATARHLARLLTSGVSPAALEKQLAQLARWVPEAERPLAQLSVMVRGRELLLRRGEGLVDVTGQGRFDFFDSVETGARGGADEGRGVADGDPPPADDAPQRLSCRLPQELLDEAALLEEEGQLERAVETYRTFQALVGPRADVHFFLAELLYRLGDVTAARERYFCALELDEDYVEARANLGCVLAETGHPELAVAAFEGALARHADYPDVHYHLARTLDELQRGEQAAEHWRWFLSLAPDSPWASEARDRLGWADASARES